MAKILHYAVLAVLALGVLYYLWVTPSSLNPMADKRAAEALALVQTHRALGYPTILQAMTEHVRSMKERGRGVRLGEWRVKQADGDLYEIRIQLRDEGEKGQWFEREFIWHAHLASKKVNAASLPADGLTPKAPDVDSPAPQNVLPPSGSTSG
ncbi:MAG TPA: hypothetical protein VEI50_13925 [Nitrospiraceae bacterium]|nr:hypothetical protein [Nitrospiraceae bacterium]